MKILFATPSIYNETGGGRISLRALIERLSKNHDVYIYDAIEKKGHQKKINFIKQNQYYSWKILKRKHRFIPQGFFDLLNEWKASTGLKNIAKKINPDIIFIQGYKLIFRSNRSRVPVVLFQRDYSFGHKGQYKNPKNYILNMPFVWNRKYRIKQYDLILANSNFIKNSLALSNDNVAVIYPFVKNETFKYKDRFKSEYIIFVNPYTIKGVSIFIQIARKMQDRNFIVVGNAEAKYEKELLNLNNVIFLGWKNAIEDEYAKSRLILIPSIWEEPFGRIAVEAGSFSIPSIASNKGGLKEAVGEGGIMVNNVNSVENWIRAIKKFDSQTFYTHKAIKAFEHSKNFDFEVIFKRFCNEIFRNFNIKLN